MPTEAVVHALQLARVGSREDGFRGCTLGVHGCAETGDCGVRAGEVEMLCDSVERGKCDHVRVV